MKIDQEWTINALIVGSFAFFGTFTISSYSALFATLLIFGIFVLPFVINELGILEDYYTQRVEKNSYKHKGCEIMPEQQNGLRPEGARQK